MEAEASKGLSSECGEGSVYVRSLSGHACRKVGEGSKHVGQRAWGVACDQHAERCGAVVALCIPWQSAVSEMTASPAFRLHAGPSSSSEGNIRSEGNLQRPQVSYRDMVLRQQGSGMSSR